VLALLALAACQDRSAPAPAPSATASAAADPDPAASARRPARHYYLARTASRCEIYRVDEEGLTPSIITPCPLDLQIGERIRIAGKTCIRESSDAERVEPVVCPDPLTNKEKRDLGLIK
jgi:hypothetical protein